MSTEESAMGKITGFTKVEPVKMYVGDDRPVVDDWKCQRSGDCCTKPYGIVMTLAEKATLEANMEIRVLNKLKYEEHPEPGFVVLRGEPCPLHEFVDGKSTCTVHEKRPYQCRRFACLRPVPSEEPFQMAPLSPYLKYGMIGCSNLRDRLVKSRIARRCYELIQRKAQRWGRTHGWKD